MVTRPRHLEAVPLNSDELEAIKECMLKVDTAPLKNHSDSEVDLKELSSVMANLTKDFAPWDKLSSSDVKSEMKVRAIRVTKPFSLAVPNTVLLVPTAITSGTPRIESQALDLGASLFLTKGVELKPGFNCLAFLLEANN